MSRQPYDMSTSKLTPAWEGCLEKWEGTQAKRTPLTWDDFFLTGPSLDPDNAITHLVRPHNPVPFRQQRTREALLKYMLDRKRSSLFSRRKKWLLTHRRALSKSISSATAAARKATYGSPEISILVQVHLRMRDRKRPRADLHEWRCQNLQNTQDHVGGIQPIPLLDMVPEHRAHHEVKGMSVNMGAVSGSPEIRTVHVEDTSTPAIQSHVRSPQAADTQEEGLGLSNHGTTFHRQTTLPRHVSPQDPKLSKVDRVSHSGIEAMRLQIERDEGDSIQLPAILPGTFPVEDSELFIVTATSVQDPSDRPLTAQRHTPAVTMSGLDKSPRLIVTNERNDSRDIDNGLPVSGDRSWGRWFVLRMISIAFEICISILVFVLPLLLHGAAPQSKPPSETSTKSARAHTQAKARRRQRSDFGIGTDTTWSTWMAVATPTVENQSSPGHWKRSSPRSADTF